MTFITIIKPNIWSAVIFDFGTIWNKMSFCKYEPYLFIWKNLDMRFHVSETRNWGHDTQVPNTGRRKYFPSCVLLTQPLQESYYSVPRFLSYMRCQVVAVVQELHRVIYHLLSGRSEVWSLVSLGEILNPTLAMMHPSVTSAKAGGMEMREWGPKCRQRRWRWILTERKP